MPVASDERHSVTPSGPGPLPLRQLADRLAQVDGFDVVRALRNVGGQQATLVRVLGCFIDTYRLGLPQQLDDGAAVDAEHWRRATHGLLGACAMIGATTLQQDLETFDPALLADDAGARLAAKSRQIHEGLIDFCSRLEREIRR